jgi:hypothetical protein
VGAAVGVVAAIVLIVVAVVIARRRRHRKTDLLPLPLASFETGGSEVCRLFWLIRLQEWRYRWCWLRWKWHVSK